MALDLRIRQLVTATRTLEAHVGWCAETPSARSTVVSLDAIGLWPLTLLLLAIAIVVLISTVAVLAVTHAIAPNGPDPTARSPGARIT
jgi:hypothetical protein